MFSDQAEPARFKYDWCITIWSIADGRDQGQTGGGKVGRDADFRWTRKTSNNCLNYLVTDTVWFQIPLLEVSFPLSATKHPYFAV